MTVIGIIIDIMIGSIIDIMIGSIIDIIIADTDIITDTIIDIYWHYY